MPPRPHWPIGGRKLLVAAFIGACAGGCGGSNHAARFVPREDVARRALVMALEAWQRGSSGPLALEDNTAIAVVDQHRRPGQSLRDFVVIGEVAGDGGRWFEVELQLDQPKQTEQVRYVVVGIDPLWVFRQTDYEMLSHWDHPMPEVSSDRL